MTARKVPDSARLMDAVDVTWPPAEMRREAGWMLRRGAGGGKRVSAASPLGQGAVADAQAQMRGWGQQPLFRLIPDDGALDAELSDRGYQVIDPVALYAAPAAEMTGDASHMAASYRCAFRIARVEEIWAAGGIKAPRLDIMDRVTAPRVTLISRAADRPCGAAFAAVDGDIAMIHAIEVLDAYRRQGAGRLLIEAAARWALDQGAIWLALAVTEANAPARALYDRLGMQVAGRYHYRILD